MGEGVSFHDVFAFAGKNKNRGNVTWQERDPLTIL